MKAPLTAALACLCMFSALAKSKAEPEYERLVVCSAMATYLAYEYYADGQDDKSQMLTDIGTHGATAAWASGIRRGISQADTDRKWKAYIEAFEEIPLPSLLQTIKGCIADGLLPKTVI
ncbi:MAG: hypothetical protein QM698_11910 [Micropepsaceae bacterium]